MDRLQAMAAFVAVVDNGGFASAARRLGLSPAVVTRAVGELEQRLGLRLLTRTTRIVRVTEAGARFAADCRRILAELDTAEADAAGVNAEPRGTLVLTAPVMFGQIHVMPIVASYLERFPAVDARCLFVDHVVNIVEEGIDVAVRIGELPDSALQAVKVGQVRRVVVASPAYLAARGTPGRPRDLQDHAVVAATGVTPSPEWHFEEGGHVLGQRVQPRLRTTTNESAIAAALAGLGITRLLSYQVAGHVRSGELQVLLADHEPAPLPVHVVHYQGRRPTAKVRSFIDLAVERLRADPALH